MDWLASQVSIHVALSHPTLTAPDTKSTKNALTFSKELFAPKWRGVGGVRLWSRAFLNQLILRSRVRLHIDCTLNHCPVLFLYAYCQKNWYSYVPESRLVESQMEVQGDERGQIGSTRREQQGLTADVIKNQDAIGKNQTGQVLLITDPRPTSSIICPFFCFCDT